MTYINGLSWNIQRTPVIQPNRDDPPEGGEIDAVYLVEIHDLWDFAAWACEHPQHEKNVKAFLMASPGFEAWARDAMDTEIEESEEDSHE